MPFKSTITGKRVMEVPACIGVRPVRSKIAKRLCTECSHYVASKKYCPLVGKITNPECAYCSWFKDKKFDH